MNFGRVTRWFFRLIKISFLEATTWFCNAGSGMASSPSVKYGGYKFCFAVLTLTRAECYSVDFEGVWYHLKYCYY